MKGRKYLQKPQYLTFWPLLKDVAVTVGFPVNMQRARVAGFVGWLLLIALERKTLVILVTSHGQRTGGLLQSLYS